VCVYTSIYYVRAFRRETGKIYCHQYLSSTRAHVRVKWILLLFPTPSLRGDGYNVRVRVSNNVIIVTRTGPIVLYARARVYICSSRTSPASTSVTRVRPVHIHCIRDGRSVVANVSPLSPLRFTRDSHENNSRNDNVF